MMPKASAGGAWASTDAAAAPVCAEPLRGLPALGCSASAAGSLRLRRLHPDSTKLAFGSH